MSTPRKANKAFNAKPKLANIIPADLAVPLLSFAGIGFMSFRVGLPPFAALVLTAWMGATYWIYVGDKPWLHLSKIVRSTPPKWTTAQSKYELRHKNVPIRKKNDSKQNQN